MQHSWCVTGNDYLTCAKSYKRGVCSDLVSLSRLVVIFAMSRTLAEGLFQGAFGFRARLKPRGLPFKKSFYGVTARVNSCPGTKP